MLYIYNIIIHTFIYIAYAKWCKYIMSHLRIQVISTYKCTSLVNKVHFLITLYICVCVCGGGGG